MLVIRPSLAKTGWIVVASRYTSRCVIFFRSRRFAQPNRSETWSANCSAQRAYPTQIGTRRESHGSRYRVLNRNVRSRVTSWRSCIVIMQIYVDTERKNATASRKFYDVIIFELLSDFITSKRELALTSVRSIESDRDPRSRLPSRDVSLRGYSGLEFRKKIDFFFFTFPSNTHRQKCTLGRISRKSRN